MKNGYDIRVVYDEEKNKTLLKPEGKEVYIFGQGDDNKREEIYNKLKDKNIFFHKLFYALKSKLTKLKLALIKNYQIDTFYESDIKVARELKKQNKDLEVFIPVPDFSNSLDSKDIRQKLKDFNT
jgi:hypothetical protein